MEVAIIHAILTLGSVEEFSIVNYAPKAVYLWLYPSASEDELLMAEHPDDIAEGQSSKGSKKSEISRKKAERADSPESRSGMMIFRLESMFSLSEFAIINQGTDDSDEDDEDNQRIVDVLDKITLSQQQDQKSARIKIDIDLPSAAEDDLPMGECISLPEWDYKKQHLVEDWCLLQPMLPEDASSKGIPPRLRKISKTIEAQFEQLRNVKCWLKGQPQGEELDLSAWLDFHVESKISAAQEKGLFKSFRGNNRDLSC